MLAYRLNMVITADVLAPLQSSTYYGDGSVHAGTGATFAPGDVLFLEENTAAQFQVCNAYHLAFSLYDASCFLLSCTFH